MNCKQILESWLKEHGYDGLCNPDLECGCAVGEGYPFIACESIDLVGCLPAYKGTNPRDDDDSWFFLDKAERDKAVAEAASRREMEAENDP